jgi:hypothetical protein
MSTLATTSTSPYVWAPGSAPADQHVAFRLTFTTAAANTTVTLSHVCVSWYNVFVDGAYAAEGPTRFMGTQPYAASTIVTLPSAGKHVVAIHAHSAGVQTRMLLSRPAAAFCTVASTDPTGHPVSAPVWTCLALSPAVYSATPWRLSPLLGWAERCSVSMGLQQSWTAVDFDDSKWGAVANVDPGFDAPVPLVTATGAGPASSQAGALTQVGRWWWRWWWWGGGRGGRGPHVQWGSRINLLVYSLV